MKALTILQPWASLIAIGAKWIETRSWSTSYRGPLVIHAGKSTKAELAFYEPAIHVKMREAGFKRFEDLPFGRIIAKCELLTVCKVEHSPFPLNDQRPLGDFTPGRFTWLLGNVKLINPLVKSKGSLGLWNLPPAIASTLKSEISNSEIEQEVVR